MRQLRSFSPECTQESELLVLARGCVALPGDANDIVTCELAKPCRLIMNTHQPDNRWRFQLTGFHEQDSLPIPQASERWPVHGTQIYTQS